MLTVCHVDIGDDVHDSSIGLFGETLILASVAGFHVEDGDMQTLRSYHAQAAGGVPKDKYAIGLGGGEEFIRAVDDVATGGSEVIAYGIHIYFGFCELQVAEKDAVEVVVVVLACVGENHVKVPATLVDDGGQTDNLRACTHDNTKLQFAVLLPLYVTIIEFGLLIHIFKCFYLF